VAIKKEINPQVHAYPKYPIKNSQSNCGLLFNSLRSAKHIPTKDKKHNESMILIAMVIENI
jgi:hypothetical protein